jgi:hypothetical protein
MKVYIAASWKHQHAVEMLTSMLRDRGHEVLSFVENNHGEQKGHEATKDGKSMPFDDWVWSQRGKDSFDYDTNSAMNSDCVLYIGPSGKDASAELGMAFARGVKIIGLYAKGEDFGLMRRMVEWVHSYQQMLGLVELHDTVISARRHN